MTIRLGFLGLFNNNGMGQYWRLYRYIQGFCVTVPTMGSLSSKKAMTTSVRSLCLNPLKYQGNAYTKLYPLKPFNKADPEFYRRCDQNGSALGKP